MPVTQNKVVTPQTPRSSSGVVTAANSTYGDTPTNTAVIFTAGPNGARVSRISAVARASIGATELQLFRDHDGLGTVRRFLESKTLPALTVAQTAGQAPVDFGYSDAKPLILAPNEKLYGASGVALAAGIVFTVEGADF
jgi:hypothetical protein